MEDTITFDIRGGYPDALEVAEAPFKPTYSLAFVKDSGIKCYRHPAFSVVKQGHDARSACFKLLEIHTTIHLRIPVHFCRNDLHWFYALESACRLEQANGERSIALGSRQRLKLYVNASDAWLLVPNGHFLLLVETFEGGWMLRFEEPEMSELRELTEYLRERKAGWRSSHCRDILTGMWIQTELLASLPNDDHMVMDSLIYVPMACKVQLDRHNGYPLAKPGEDPGLVKDIIRLIQAKLQLDPPFIPRVETLANALRLSRHQLWEQFKAAVKGTHREGHTIKEIIDLERLEASRELLAKGASLQMVAYQLGYSSQSAYGRQFKKHLGMTPGGYLRKAPLR